MGFSGRKLKQVKALFISNSIGYQRKQLCCYYIVVNSPRNAIVNHYIEHDEFVVLSLPHKIVIAVIVIS